MSTFTVISEFSHRYLMNKTKNDIVQIAMEEHRRVTELQKAILKYGRHTDDCAFRSGHDCDCGIELKRNAARAWLEG